MHPSVSCFCPSLDCRHHIRGWLVVQPLRMPLVPGRRVNLGSVPISCLYTHAAMVTAEPRQTRQRLLTDGMLKGEASEEERAQEAEETVVKSHLQQGKFIHHLQGRHKKRGRRQASNLSARLRCQHGCQSDTHPLCRHTNTTGHNYHHPRPV